MSAGSVKKGEPRKMAGEGRKGTTVQSMEEKKDELENKYATKKGGKIEKEVRGKRKGRGQSNEEP